MTELRWEGKYKDGKRVAPVRIALPFQTVETVNESAQVRAHALDLWTQGQPSEWRNRLIWGDKKYVLPSLLAEYAGQVNLIYIDPPFATGADFSFTTTIPESDESFTKEPSMIETKAYRDMWGQGLDSYLQWFAETVVMLRELLAENGSIYVHCDWRIVHYIRIVLDNTFGPENYRNDITWKRAAVLGRKAAASQFGRVTDTLLYYVRNETANPIWNRPYMERIVDVTDFHWDEKEQKFFKTSPRGDYTDASIAELRKQNRVHDTNTGGIRIKYFLDKDSQGRWVERLPADCLWLDIPDMMHIPDSEKTGYPTQKPEALLERIIRASSNEDDLVLDCFCGSGTTAAVAEKLGRRWITCDLGRFAIHTARKRLLSIPNVRPFVVQNLGKYERQAWQVAEFAEGDQKQSPAVQLAYRRFMLDLYRAQPIQGYTWLHGVRDGRLVHVGGVDAPVAVGDIQQIVKEVWKVASPAASGSPSPVGEGAGGERSNGVDILGWDFAFELNEVAAQMAAAANVHLKFKRVPREVLEKKAVEQGDIKFFELAALSVAVSQKDREGLSGVRQDRGPHVTITLTDFVVPPDDVPEEVQRAVTNWSQWIDYWAVDWDYKGDTFHNMAQTYRTRKQTQLQQSLAHTYEQPGVYTVVVKVIDILGNDTTKTLKVEVG